MENPEENRIQIFFDDRVSTELFKFIRSRGFVWARSIGAFQRMLNNQGIYQVNQVIAQVQKESANV